MNRIKRSQPLLGTFVEITLEGRTSEERLHQDASKAFDLIRFVASLMSFHDPNSDVSRLNRCGHLAPLTVHPWTWQVIAQAVKLSAASEGAFDITIAPKLVEWGFLPEHESLTAQVGKARWRDLELGPNQTIYFRRPLQIDLGGIAKGFAVDKAIDWLSARPIQRAIVNAGGDLRVSGIDSEAVCIRHPAAPQTQFHPTEMLRPAVATSAAYFAQRRHGGSLVCPIVHPETQQSLRSQVSVSVFAPTCILADALTKTVLLAPAPIRDRLLREHDSVALCLPRRGHPILYPN